MKKYLTQLYVFALIFLTSCFPLSLKAQCIASTANSGSVFASSTLAGGSYSWNNPTNIINNDGVYSSAAATLSILSGTTHYLKATGFNFNIPPGTIICGISVSMRKRATGLGLFSDVSDNIIKLVVDGTITGDNKARASTWPGSFSYINYGGAADLWGTALTTSDINDPNFGVVISANLDGLVTLLPNAQVDQITVTAYYNYYVLPSTLLSFQSSLNKNIASHQWMMAEQEEQTNIVIQRKKDGSEWTSLSTYTNVEDGDKLKYTYNDKLTEVGRYYYRLKLISANGSIQYSKINTIDFSSYSKLKIAPNPAAHQITVSNALKNNGITLYNSAGQQMNVLVQWMDEKTAKVNIAPLPRGFYYLRNNMVIEPFMKE